MFWFAIIAAAVLAAALVWWTIANAKRMLRPSVWTAATMLTLIFGMFVGFWFGNGTRYAVSPTVEFQGFPIPLAIFVFEDGRWVDYIGFLPFALVNALFIAALVLSPL